MPQVLNKTKAKNKNLSVLLGIVIALCGSGSVFSQDFYSYVNGSTAVAHYHGVIAASNVAPTQIDVAPNSTTGYGFSLFNSSTTVPGRFQITVQNMDTVLDLWCGFDNSIGTAAKSAIQAKGNAASVRTFNVTSAVHLFCTSSNTAVPHAGCSIFQLGVK